ncbi:hypothetical protein H6G45_17530 [Synechocystis sp. FACHB-383]|uniref:nuclease domain-containing protein n=1 Tax=Synechocystis sp. FACHB-383 TaxID=2692864 RepID=UPI001681C7A7|nr:nuclease domain-containing protein [Synechocystis sp. FACHB-383]MBD2655251.1 hypothetical protein [Synechocystis sp. FACHB-383]
MIYPTIKFINFAGKPLPLNDDKIPYVEQYGEKWFVDLGVEWSGGVAIEGEKLFQLKRQLKRHLWAPDPSLSGDITRRSGEITVFLTDEHGKIIESSKEKLKIYPANITEDQMKQMLREIGTLALTTTCCVRRKIEAPIIRENFVEAPWLNSYLATAQSLIELAELIKDLWSDIEKRPLKSIISTVDRLSVNEASYSPQLLIQKALKPGKKSFLGFTRVESLQCEENEFLCYVFDYYLGHLAFSIQEQLKSVEIKMQKNKNKFSLESCRRKDQDFLEFADRVLSSQSKKEIVIEKVEEVIKDLEKAIQWSKNIRNSSFLSQIQTPDRLKFSSQRLTESYTYGSIIKKLLFIYNEDYTKINILEKIFEVTQKIFYGRVKPTWEIYEIWCFIKLYSAFILNVGLKPISDQDNIFLYLFNDSSTLDLPKNKIFKLAGHIEDIAQYEVEFTYESQCRNINNELRKPDIFIKIRIDGQEKNYVFDAKYRNYKSQDAKYNKKSGETFREDVIDTAKNKYLEGLGLTASFILHSDPGFDYWGEVPFSNYIQEKFQENIYHDSRCVGHKYGAIQFIPNSDNSDDNNIQLERIIRLLLQYHQDIHLDKCIFCGYKLEYGKDILNPGINSLRKFEKESIDGIFYQSNFSGRVFCSCPQCSDFWIIQRCYGKHHKILKFDHTFHRHSDWPEYKGKWMFICPECGSDPRSQDLINRS